jgi:hypothetical protein
VGVLESKIWTTIQWSHCTTLCCFWSLNLFLSKICILDLGRVIVRIKLYTIGQLYWKIYHTKFWPSMLK